MQEQEKEQAQLAAINEIIKTIGSSLDLRQVYDTFATQLKKLVAFDRASITLIEGDNLRFFALSSATESELDEERVVPLEGTATQWVAAHKEAYIADDLAKERQFWIEDIRFQEGLKSRIHIPLFSRGEVIGAFNLNSRQPNAYGEKEREILEQIAGPLAVAIENFRLFEQAQAATEELRASEEKFRSLVEGINDAYIVVRKDRIIFANQRCAELYGYRLDELIGQPFTIRVAPEAMGEAREILQKSLRRESVPERYELMAIKKDGTRFPVEVSLRAITYEGRSAYSVIERDITERKRAEERIKHLNLILHAIRNVNQLIASEEDRDRLFKSICDNLIETRGYHAAWIALIDDSGDLVTTAEAGLGKDFLPMVERLKRDELPDCGRRALRQSDVVVIEHPLSTCAGCPLADKYHGRGAMTVQLEYGGMVYGLLSASIPTEIPAEEEERSLFKELATDIAFALHSMELEEERKQAEEEIARYTEQLEVLHAVAATVSETLELEQMLNGVLEKVVQMMEVDAGYITSFDVETRTGSVKAHRGLSEQFVGQIGGEERDEDVRRWLEYREPAFGLRRIYSEPTLTKVLVAAENEGLQSFVTVPLWCKDVLHGALVLASRAPRRFSTEDLDLLKAIANEIAVGIENARLFEEVRNAAITDGLTGLYNHRHFQERLEEEVARALRFGGECSLVMLDLDYFKIYNDLFGHVAGDEALRRLGQVVRDHTRQVDTAYRYGGEEFAVILPQTGPSYAYQAAERLRQTVETAFALESSVTSASLTVSLGVASCPGDALSREELIQRADLALREAKERGRNQTYSASELLGAATGKGKEGWEIMQHLKAAGPNKVYALAAGVDARDHYTYGHSQNVSRHAVAIGQALGLPDVEIKQLRIAALLHDIGKIGLSDSIIRKPGPLDAEEWKTMKKHSELGATIISHMPELADCAPTIRHHHEWYDGSGYPSGLKGEDIPLAARIIAIADAYDTMTTPRSYRQMVSPEEALEELRRCAKTQFDPLLVETFARLVTAGVEGTS